MTTRYSVPAIILSAMLSLIASSLRADAISENFSITVPTITLFPNQFRNVFDTTGFDQFNPANGTLNSFTVTLTGPATWSGGNSNSGQMLGASLGFIGSLVPVGTNSSQVFTGSPGGSTSINFNISAMNNFPPPPDAEIGFLIGRGTTAFNLTLDAPGTTFSTNPSLMGTIVYNFTPNASAVPEPSTVALLGAGILGLVGFAHKARRRESR